MKNTKCLLDVLTRFLVFVNIEKIKKHKKYENINDRFRKYTLFLILKEPLRKAYISYDSKYDKR